MLKSHKAQATIELLIYFVAALGLMVAITSVIIVNTNSRTTQIEQEGLRSVVDTLFDEVLLATQVSEGYARNFTLPEKISGKEYTVSIINESVIIASTSRFESSKIIFQTEGQPLKGTNTIRKTNGTITLNE